MSSKVFDQPPVFKKTTLANGVRVVTEHHKHSRATAVGYFVTRGTRDEPSHLAGAAHFLEHLVFKGTAKRSAFEIARSLESLGGDLNAFTSRETTCFHSTTLREHLPISMNVLSDLLQNALFRSEDFALEREVILQEIHTSADSFEEYIFDLFFENVYKGHSLGRPILGTEKSLSNIKKDDLKKFYQDHYGGAEMIVSVAGSVDHDLVVEMVEKDFKKKHNPKSSLQTPRTKPRFRKVTKWIERPSEQIHVVIGFPSVSFKHKLRFNSYIANALLGGGMTSRLYQKLREELGLAYTIDSYLHSFTDSGLLTVYLATSEKNLPKALSALGKELGKLVNKGAKDSEIEMYKTQVRGQILLAADDVENRMNSLGVNEMTFGEYRPVENVIADIEKVNSKSFQAYLNETLDLDNACVLFLGKTEKTKKKEWEKFKF